MNPTLEQTQVLSKIANLLYNWLPGSAPPFGRVYTFEDAARKNALEDYWLGGSKLPAIQHLLEGALLEHKFCPLIVDITREGIKYRNKKSRPITRGEMDTLNRILRELGFKIPELNDVSFLNSMPVAGDIDQVKERAISPSEMSSFKRRYDLLLQNPDHQSRGYELQGFLYELFGASGLQPRGPFRVIGEEIDGSFALDGEIYLLEARWRKDKASKTDLSSFSDKVQRKSEWTRGLFISIAGFSEDGLGAMIRGKSPNFIIMSGKDLKKILGSEIDLNKMLREKVRNLAERGEFKAEE